MSDESETPSGPKMVAPLSKQAGPGWLSRLLWMGPRVAEARAATFRPPMPGYEWYGLARQFRDDITRIGESRRSEWAVILLGCSAVGALVRAHLAREGLLADAGTLGEADWENARKIGAIAEVWNQLPAEQMSMIVAMLGADREVTMAKLSGEGREALATSVHLLVDQLAAPLDMAANRLGFALWMRWLRVGGVVLFLAAGLAVAASLMGSKFFKPNLALHRPVTVSSQYPLEGKDPNLLVDGDSENLGFHTEEQGQQWVMIDLGAVFKFDKIVVYNRVETHIQQRAVPLRVEVSKDNQNYVQVAERKENFDKWTAKGLHAEGRYVRLKNTPNNYFHLAEVEIY
jgi:hypothetical protein